MADEKDFDQVVSEYKSRTIANMSQVMELMNELLNNEQELSKQIEGLKKERDELAAEIAQMTQDRYEEIVVDMPNVDDPVVV